MPRGMGKSDGKKPKGAKVKDPGGYTSSKLGKSKRGKKSS